MKTVVRKIFSALLASALALSLCIPVFAADKDALDTAVNAAAKYMLNTVKNPQVGSIGGEWAVLGLARSGYDVPASYFENYYKTVEKYVRESKGVLHKVKYTEYSRVILGLTAAGRDPQNVAGYDLTKPLADFDKTVWQGINGPIFALIALDSGDYPIPDNTDAETQATRDMYIDEILRRQTPDGGWNLTAGINGAAGANEQGDPDLTGMALQALAKYQDKPAVKDATDRALALLSRIQDGNGGYGSGFSGGAAASESAAQVLVALCELGIPADDERFVKNGSTVIDNILSFQNSDGSFRHTQSGGDGDNQMASEQAFYALAAAKLASEGKASLYRMSDASEQPDASAAPVTEPEQPPAETEQPGEQPAVTAPAVTPPVPTPAGLPGKHEDVSAVPVTKPGTVFGDTADHPNKTAIEALAAREIMSGDGGVFGPDMPVSRAEFAGIVTAGLDLPEQRYHPFTDVLSGQRYAYPIATAYYYEIVSAGDSQYDPDGFITRQDAAVMVTQAAKLCGMDIERTEVEIRDTLAQFGDYRSAAAYAQSSLAFCYSEEILDDAAFEIEPAKAVTRAEAAEMLYRLLDRANLL